MKLITMTAILMFTLSSGSHALFGGDTSAQTSDQSSSPARWMLRADAGASVFIVGSRASVEPAVALRVRRTRFFAEAGGTLPRHVADDFKQDSPTIGGMAYSVNVENLAEIHLAAGFELPHGRQEWIVPEAALGVSMRVIKNRAEVFDPAPPATVWTDNPTKIAVSPLLRLGVVFRPASRLSFRFDAAYVSYPNTFTFQGRSFNLRMSGWTLRPMLEARW